MLTSTFRVIICLAICNISSGRFPLYLFTDTNSGIAVGIADNNAAIILRDLGFPHNTFAKASIYIQYSETVEYSLMVRYLAGFGGP